MNENIKKLIKTMDINEPATEQALKEIEKEIGIALPEEYREFMLESNGAEGTIGEFSYLALWSIEEIVPLNQNYKVEECTPGLVFFASDGGGTAYAFDKRPKEIKFVEIPDDSIHIEEATLCGNTFEQFLHYLYGAKEE